MYVDSKYFSLILSFLVKSAISDFSSRKVPLVEGQKVGPFISREISSFVRVRWETLTTLIDPASEFVVSRFLTTVWLGAGLLQREFAVLTGTGEVWVLH